MEATDTEDWLAAFGSEVEEAQVDPGLDSRTVEPPDYSDPFEAIVEQATTTNPTMGDGSPIEFRCIECGTPLTYGGRGRKPKYCAEHKPSARKTTGTTSTPRGKSLSKQLEGIREEFSDNIRLVGALITPALPVTGRVILTDADLVADSVVKLARNNPKVLLALQRASQVGPGVVFARSLVTIGIAVAVDTKRLEPDSQLAFMMGIAAHYDAIYGDENRTSRTSPDVPKASFV